MRRAAWRIRKRIQNLTSEAHRKVALDLCRHYDVILLPEFQVSEMVPRQQRKIGRKTVRQMLLWSHYKLRKRILDKAEEYGRVVHLVGEEYTSKCCGLCGKLNHGLGGNKQFRCVDAQCGYTLDRDFNGARNILLKNLDDCELLLVPPPSSPAN